MQFPRLKDKDRSGSAAGDGWLGGIDRLSERGTRRLRRVIFPVTLCAARSSSPSHQQAKFCHYISLYSGQNHISDFNFNLSCFFTQ